MILPLIAKLLSRKEPPREPPCKYVMRYDTENPFPDGHEQHPWNEEHPWCMTHRRWASECSSPRPFPLDDAGIASVMRRRKHLD